MTCATGTCSALFSRHPDLLQFLLDYDDDRTTEAENVAGFERLLSTGLLAKLSPDMQHEAELILGRPLGR